MPSYQEWVRKIDINIDYYSAFIKSWIAFNSWYRSEYTERTDRGIIEKLKTENNHCNATPSFCSIAISTARFAQSNNSLDFFLSEKDSFILIAIFSCCSISMIGITTFSISDGFQCWIIAPFVSLSACICTIEEFNTKWKQSLHFQKTRVYANYNTKARTNQESICRNGKADCRKRGEE